MITEYFCALKFKNAWTYNDVTWEEKNIKIKGYNFVIYANIIKSSKRHIKTNLKTYMTLCVIFETSFILVMSLKVCEYALLASLFVILMLI